MKPHRQVMPQKILVVLGHPARARRSLGETLAEAYATAATEAGHTVRILKIAALAFDPVLHEGYAGDQPPEPDLVAAQDSLLWADHWVIVYPLWQLMIPALLKGFFERTLVRGFAYTFHGNRPVPHPRLRGKTAQLIQTSAMPGVMYRWLSGQHAAKACCGMLKLCGITAQATYLGLAQAPSARRVDRFLRQVRRLARQIPAARR